MKISRNAPCPCDSGKKYKRYCGADIQPNNEPTQGMNSAQQLAQAIEASGASTLEEMNAIAMEMSAESNARPIKEFLGLSHAQMSRLLHAPLDSPELVTFKEDWFPEQANALQLFDALASRIGSEGINPNPHIGTRPHPKHLCERLSPTI